MYTNEKTIRFSETSDIVELVNAASKCDFDIDVKYNRFYLDAKSILGIMGIGLKNDCKVCFDGKNKQFQNVLDKFAIA